MRINLFNIEDFIKINHLKEITSPIIFQRGDTPTPNGLLSNEIFGVTIKSRKETFAYISLNDHFFHPHVYKAIRRLYRNIDKIINGELTVSIDNEGKLVEDENGESGLGFIYDNWEKIKWEKSADSGMRNERIDLLTNFKKDEIFVKYLIVIPPFYRDIRSTGSSGGETNDLNKYYANAIRYASFIKERNIFGFQFDMTCYNMQTLLVDIYDYFKSKLEKKTGILRRYLLGKNVDYCTRTVITGPMFKANRPNELITDFGHSAIPISQLVSLCNPFVTRWIKNFIERNVIENKDHILVFDPTTNKPQYAKLKNPESVFTDKWIKTIIDTYVKDPSSRFNKIELPVEGSKHTYYMIFSGKKLEPGTNAETASIIYRPFTNTDLLYMACVDSVKDKHAMITRYPLTDEFGIFITKVRVNSTLNTEPELINGTVYKWYPVIEFDTPHEKIATKFIDSVQFSNSYLEGIGGDYDGDQTTVKILFTQEANEECERNMKSKTFYVNSAGKFMRVVSNEVVQTFFVLTKDPTTESKTVTPAVVDSILRMEPKDMTFEFLVNLLADTTDDEVEDKNTKITTSKWNPTDRVNITTNNSFGFKGPTTLGRLIYNKVVLEGSHAEKIVGYINKPITDGVNGDIEKLIASAIINDKLSIENTNYYINARDWLGLQLHPVVTTSFSPNVIKVPPAVKKLHKELNKKYEKALNENDPIASEKIEKALASKTMECLKGDYGLDLYVSGARGSMKNNYKNINLTRGAIPNVETGGYDIIKGSLMDGLDKKDVAAHSNSILSGAYAKGVETQNTGYLSKELASSMQSEVLDDPGSDCGTHKTLDILITAKNTNDYMYRYIVENEKLVCLTPDVIKKYIGKTVKMRSPMFCLSTHICSKCAGEQFYKLGKKFIGLTTTKVATTLTNLNMKKFHSNLIEANPIDINDMLL